MGEAGLSEPEQGGLQSLTPTVGSVLGTGGHEWPGQGRPGQRDWGGFRCGPGAVVECGASICGERKNRR